jgi:transcriptional regulator with XRE-family HTH domain
MNSAGEKIRALRIKKNLSLDQLAELSNTSKSYIWELENRPTRKPTLDKISLIANALGVALESLIEENREPEEEVAEKGFFRKFKKLDERDKEVIEYMMKFLSESKR